MTGSMTFVLLKRHLRHARWLVGSLMLFLVGFQLLIIHLGEAFDAGPGIQDFLNSLPQILHDIVNSQLAARTFPAFVAFGFMHPASLVACSGVVVLLASSTAGERDTGLRDLLLARPLSRRQHLAASAWAVAVVAILLPLSLLTGCAAGLQLVDVPSELPWTSYVLAACLMSSLLLAVGGFTLLVSVRAQRRGTAVTQVLATLLVTYVLDTLSKVVSQLDPMKWLTPFHYFDPMASILEDGSPLIGLGVLLSLAVVSTFFAFRDYQTRDL